METLQCYVSQLTVVQCPELVDPANGYIYQSSKIYQAKVTITCDAGYVYSERSFQHRTCKADGTWSGKQGVCKSKENR